MRPVKPSTIPEGTQLVIFAKNQPEYIPLPAAMSAEGIVMTEWVLTEEEWDRVLAGGRVRLWIQTTTGSIQPVKLEVAEPECGARES